MSKTILITGSSSGIGKATALLFCRKGLECDCISAGTRKDTIAGI